VNRKTDLRRQTIASEFTSAVLGGFSSSARSSSRHKETKPDSEEHEPGDFYWHEDWQPPSPWRRLLIALRHILGMKK
jgi:hypothetical protein